MHKPKIWKWYEQLKRVVRELRYMCVSLLTIGLVIAKVIDAVAKLYWSCSL